MNIEKLKDLEAEFFEQYPKGFDDEEILKIRKRFKSEKFSEEVHELFKKEHFSSPEVVCENYSKIVSKSPLISLFEKPKLRDAIKSMSMYKKDMLSIALFELLHGDFKVGFEELVEILSEYKLAKWSIVSLLPYYNDRADEYFIKPTTTKNIIKYMQIENLVYKPKPSYEFYINYKKALNEMKTKVDKSLGIDNAGFTGFLWMSLKTEEL